MARSNELMAFGFLSGIAVASLVRPTTLAPEAEGLATAQDQESVRAFENRMSALVEQVGKHPRKITDLLPTLTVLLELLAEYLQTERDEPPAAWLGKQLLARAKEAPKESAYARGEQVKRELIEAEGGCWTAAEVAEHMGMTRQAVDKRRAQGKLLAVTHHKRGYLYPRWQFGLNGIEQVFEELSDEDSWTKMLFMLNPTPRFDGASPLRMLRQGHLDEVLQFTRHWGETTAT